MNKKEKTHAHGSPEQFDNALDLLLSFMQSHRDIRLTIWLAAFHYFMAMTYKANCPDYESYCSDMEKVKAHYRRLFDEDE